MSLLIAPPWLRSGSAPTRFELTGRSPRGFCPSIAGYFFAAGAAVGGAGGAGGGGASEFHVSRMYSHFPSFLRETERNLPVSTTAPFTVTLYVPDSQPMAPDTPTSVFGSFEF